MTKSNFKDFLFSKRKDLILKGDYCTDLVDHDGERGRANEGHFSRFLKEFLPKKYKVGTGFIESVDDSRLRWSSPQTDIILYDDSNNSPLYISDDWGIFPIEMVHAVIEVKTTLRKGNNKATITELYKSFRENKDLRTHSKNKTYLQKHPVILENGKAVIGYDPISHDLPPRFFIFAYDVDEKDFPNIQKLKSFLIEKVCSQEEYNTHYHGIYVLKKNWFLYRKAHQDEHTAVEFEGDDAWVVFLNQMNFSLEDVVLPCKIDMTRYIEGLDKTLSFTDGCSPMGLKDED